MVLRSKCLVLIFILLLGIANVSFKGTSNSIPIFPVGSRSTIVVNASGGGDYTNIQSAIDNATNGDEIFIRAGTYYENIIIDKELKIEGEGNTNTFIHGNDTGDVVRILSNNVVLSGLHVKDIDGNYAGIHLIHVENCQIYSTISSDTLYGLYLNHSDNNLICNNTYRDNRDGIRLLSSSINHIQDNLNIYNDWYGIYLLDSTSNIIKDNGCRYNGASGIDIDESNDNLVIDNVCNSNWNTGIGLLYSERNNVSNNICRNNEDSGIHCCRSGNNTFFGNLISDTSPGTAKGHGIYITTYCYGNRVLENKIERSCHGIAISSSETVVSKNEIKNNGEIGLRCSGDNNIIYHNTFIENAWGREQATDSGTGNIWYSDMSGNYWSVWASPDDDEDGIIDNPYEIDGSASSMDLYPLVAPIDEIVPVADAGSDGEILQHQSFEFDSSNSKNRTFITNFDWNFTYDNRNITKNGPTKSFTFHIAGQYLVTLNATDRLGRWTEDTMILNVRDITPPLADAGSDFFILQNQLATFNASRSSDNLGIVNYTWKFNYEGELQMLYEKFASFLFKEVGIYDVTLRVSDGEGNWDTDSLAVTIIDNTPPNAKAGSDVTINQSESFGFLFHQNSTDNVGIYSWVWTFEYGDIGQRLYYSEKISSYPYFSFENLGEYVVTMNVTDEAGNWAIDTLNVTVLDNEPPEAHAGDDTGIDVNITFKFNGSESLDNIGILNFMWTFEYNGKTVTLHGPKPDFKFEIPGDYTVTLNVTDSQGNSAEDHLQITVNPRDDVIPPDGDDTDGGEKQEEKEMSTYIMAGTILLAFLAAIIGIFIVYIRKRKRKDQPGEEFGRIDNKERSLDEGGDDGNDRENG